jgi:predicted transposase YbfD/YdcC
MCKTTKRTFYRKVEEVHEVIEVENGESVSQEIIERLGEIPDYRRPWGNKRHELVDILYIALCTIVCGMTEFEEMVIFAEERIEWLRKYIEMKNGIPSASTFERVFQALNGKEMQAFYRSWAWSLRELRIGKDNQISYDGKTIRGAGAAQKVHMVSAWAHEAGLCLGQIRVDEKSNEITAIPELLMLLDMRGSVVSIDAMGCQKEIAATIMEKGADYVLAVKENQLTLAREIEECFAWIDAEGPKEIPVDHWKGKYEKDHGRIERREVRMIPCPTWPVVQAEWTGITSLVEYKCSREAIGGEKTLSKRYYISSLSCSAEKMGGYLRNHWSIENQLHWMLDVAFKEDSVLIRTQNAPENLNILRKIALSLLRDTPTPRRSSVNSKMARAMMSTDFLEKVLFA